MNRHTKHRLAPLVLTASFAMVVMLAGCATPASTTSTETPAADSGAAEGTAFPGTSGEIVLVSASAVQVQGDGAQTAVRWTDATTFTEQVAGSLADIAVGDCVVAIGEGTATTITVSEPADGECAGGFMGGGGMPGGGAAGAGDEGGERPEGLPTDLPTDAPSGAPTDGGFPAGGGAITAGLVTAVDATSITVEAAADAEGDDSEPTTTAVDATTIVLTSVATDSSALAVGLCVTAAGEPDSSGGLDATTVSLSQPTDEGCSTRGIGGGQR